MNIDFTKIVADKVAQMEKDGVIQREIEKGVESTVLSAVRYELSGRGLSGALQEQLKTYVAEAAKDLGLAAYNGYIAQAVKAIIADVQQQDLADKVRSALEEVVLKKYESVKLSEIFQKYREWVRDWVDECEWYERKKFTAELVEHQTSRYFGHYTCRFAEEPIDADEDPDVSVVVREGGFGVFKITSLFLNGHDLKNTLHIGTLTEFEAFVANLFYNGTQIIMDVDDIDDDCSFYHD